MLVLEWSLNNQGPADFSIRDQPCHVPDAFAREVQDKRRFSGTGGLSPHQRQRYHRLLSIGCRRS